MEAERGADEQTRAQVDYPARSGSAWAGQESVSTPRRHAHEALGRTHDRAERHRRFRPRLARSPRALFQRRQPADLDRLLEVLRQLEPMREGARRGLPALAPGPRQRTSRRSGRARERERGFPIPRSGRDRDRRDRKKTPAHKPKARGKGDEEAHASRRREHASRGQEEGRGTGEEGQEAEEGLGVRFLKFDARLGPRTLPPNGGRVRVPSYAVLLAPLWARLRLGLVLRLLRRVAQRSPLALDHFPRLST